MGARRIEPQANEWIDRKAPVSFIFEGERYDGYEGDVVSSALLANDRAVMARSFKYHRPRGVLSVANHDANVLLSCGERTNIRADVEPIANGKSYRAVNTIGGLRWDLAQLLRIFAKVLPVGFYYKAFYRPKALFPYWESLIRRMAGLGKITRDARPVRQHRRNRFCDVLIIGGGVAGLSAARQFVDRSLDVIVADENREFGGSFDYLHADDDGIQANKLTLLNELGAADNIEMLGEHFAAGFYADNSVPLVGPAGIVHVHAKSVIFATGLYEQPAVFRNNDLPGIMLSTGARRLVHRFAIAPCTNAVVLAGNDEAYAAAFDLQAAGVRISAIVDLDPPQTRGPLTSEALSRGIQVIPEANIDEALAKGGRLHRVHVKSKDAPSQSIDCDGLIMSVGWAPAAGILYQAGARLEYNKALGQVVPTELPRGCFCAGRLNGVFEYRDQDVDARAAAGAALDFLGIEDDPTPMVIRETRAHSHPYPINAHSRGKNFVDFDEDLQLSDLTVAYREGFDSVELMKRYSTIGMGPSQGKVSNMNGVRVLADLRGSAVQAIGVTTPRPFTHPVPMGALAGRRIRRQWWTPMHAYHLNQQADVQEAGTWLRPMSYASGSPVSAIEREYQLVRDAVGLIDVSTLGKIELFGPDTIALLEYAYTCAFDKLKQGMTRYIFMVDSSGTLVDDGVAARLGDDHFYITATSSHAQAVVRSLQQIVDQLGFDVAIIDRTHQVAALNLAGPRSREVLAKLTDLNLDDEHFPYLAIHDGLVSGVQARLMRVGFVGELGFEIHFPAGHGAGLWEALMNAGRDVGIGPFGVEAQRLLRLEKGHLIFGQDTDGTTNPFEVNLGWGVRLSKQRFVGKHSLTLLKPRLSRRLVGFKTTQDPSRQLAECHLVINDDAIAGRITSVAYSPYCRAVIGLAMVDIDLTELGTVLEVRATNGDLIVVEVSDPAFYDPENLRQRDDSQVLNASSAP